MKRSVIYIFVISLIALLSSCSGYQKLLKSGDVGLKYEKAIEYFNEKDYLKAFPLFEDLLNVYKGTSKAEKIYFYYAYCQYMTDDLVLASYHFKSFAKMYANNEKAEEALYLGAYCYFLSSPSPTLDQTNTTKAIDELQYFTNVYPKSKRVDTCNLLIDELRFKLETKSFLNAKLYYHTGNYNSAIISFKNLLKDYPNSKFKEEALYLCVKSAYTFARLSVDSKKATRYNDTLKEYNNFIKFKGKDTYKKEVEDIYNVTKQELAKINTQKNL